MMKFVNWIKKLFTIVENYDRDQEKLRYQVQRAIQLIRSRTSIHVDVGYRPSENQVILIGRYRNRDYIRVHDVNADSFKHLVDHLREMEQFGEIKKVDAPIVFEAVVDRGMHH